MSDRYILSIDQGTTGTTVLILDFNKKPANQVLSRSNVEFPQYFPKAGWVEHDLNEIWASVQKASANALEEARSKDAQFHPEKIASVGITNQRETLCVWDRKTGKPLRKAIVWQCRRSTEICKHLKAENLEQQIRERTGLLADPYFSGSKIKWLMSHDHEVRSALESGRAILGTIDSWLISCLTNGNSFVTEASNASRTLLYNIHSGSWDKELCDIFSVPGLDCLPEIKDSAGEFGRTRGLGFLPDGIPINGVLGDQQAALAGQGCFEPGEGKCTYGTGAFLLLQLGTQNCLSSNGLLTTISWQLNGKKYYALEGASFIAGAAVQFMRDKLSLVETAAETEFLAADVTGAPEIYFVPALTGLGAPWWTPEARGAFFGLTRGTSKNQMIRASLEGMAFQVCDLLESMKQDSSTNLSILRVDGGASVNNLLMQVQADLANVNVERPVNTETTALGAALFAGLGAGLFSDISELLKQRETDRCYTPDPNKVAGPEREAMLSGWKNAVGAVRYFAGYKEGLPN